MRNPSCKNWLPVLAATAACATVPAPRHEQEQIRQASTTRAIRRALDVPEIDPEDPNPVNTSALTITPEAFMEQCPFWGRLERTFWGRPEFSFHDDDRDGDDRITLIAKKLTADLRDALTVDEGERTAYRLKVLNQRYREATGLMEFEFPVKTAELVELRDNTNIASWNRGYFVQRIRTLQNLAAWLDDAQRIIQRADPSEESLRIPPWEIERIRREAVKRVYEELWGEGFQCKALSTKYGMDHFMLYGISNDAVTSAPFRPNGVPHPWEQREASAKFRGPSFRNILPDAGPDGTDLWEWSPYQLSREFMRLYQELERGFGDLQDRAYSVFTNAKGYYEKEKSKRTKTTAAVR